MRSGHPWVFKFLTLPLASSQDCSALVQSRSPVVQSRRIEPADFDGPSQTTGLAALAQLEVELSAYAQADPHGWSNDELNKLKEFLAVANTNMLGVLDAEKNADQQEWDDAAVQRKGCHDSTEKRFMQGGDVFYEAKVRDSAKGIHTACRGLEVQWNSITSAVKACDTSAALVWTDSSPPALSPSLATLHAAMDSFQAEKSTYADLEPSQPTCSEAQLEYESQYCSWRQSKRSACQAEATCITLLDMTSKQESLQTRVTQRRSLRSTLTKLICQMTHLLTTFQSENASAPEEKSDFAMANKCNETTVDDALDDQNFTLSASAYCTLDSDVSFYPSDASCNEGTSSWLTDATFGYGWNASYVVPSTCRHKCLDAPAPIPSPAPIAGCTDSATEASDCLMFEHHSDACSHEAYKVDGFDPAVECCACGGGKSNNDLTGVCPFLATGQGGGLECGWPKNSTDFKCGRKNNDPYTVKDYIPFAIPLQDVAQLVDYTNAGHVALLKNGSLDLSSRGTGKIDNKWDRDLWDWTPPAGASYKSLVVMFYQPCIYFTNLVFRCFDVATYSCKNRFENAFSGTDMKMISTGSVAMCAIVGESRKLKCIDCSGTMGTGDDGLVGPFQSAFISRHTMLARKVDGTIVQNYVTSHNQDFPLAPDNIGNITTFHQIGWWFCVVHDGPAEDGGGDYEVNANGVKCWGPNSKVVLSDAVKNSQQKPARGYVSHGMWDRELCLIYNDGVLCMDLHDGEDTTVTSHSAFQHGFMGSDTQCNAVQQDFR